MEMLELFHNRQNYKQRCGVVLLDEQADLKFNLTAGHHSDSLLETSEVALSSDTECSGAGCIDCQIRIRSNEVPLNHVLRYTCWLF